MSVIAKSLVACIIEHLEGEPSNRGRPRLPAADVVATLHYFLREGVQWRALPAREGHASAATLRRRLGEWRDCAVLPRVHAVLLRMARSDPETAARELDVIVDSCSVRAKHGGDLTGPNPTDRGKPGTTTSSAGAQARRSLLPHRRRCRRPAPGRGRVGRQRP